MKIDISKWTAEMKAHFYSLLFPENSTWSGSWPTSTKNNKAQIAYDKETDSLTFTLAPGVDGGYWVWKSLKLQRKVDCVERTASYRLFVDMLFKPYRDAGHTITTDISLKSPNDDRSVDKVKLTVTSSANVQSTTEYHFPLRQKLRDGLSTQEIQDQVQLRLLECNVLPQTLKNPLTAFDFAQAITNANSAYQAFSDKHKNDGWFGFSSHGAAGRKRATTLQESAERQPGESDEVYLQRMKVALKACFCETSFFGEKIGSKAHSFSSYLMNELKTFDLSKMLDPKTTTLFALDYTDTDRFINKRWLRSDFIAAVQNRIIPSPATNAMNTTLNSTGTGIENPKKSLAINGQTNTNGGSNKL